MDESGAPGVATTENDFLVVSLVIFESKDVMEKCSRDMKLLRKTMKLKPEYEFHCSHNSKDVRKCMTELVLKTECEMMTIAIRKNLIKKFASYQHIAQVMAAVLVERYEALRIIMDVNPVLFRALRIEFRKMKSYRVTEKSSQKDDFIQFADYVVNLTAKAIRQNDWTKKNGKLRDKHVILRVLENQTRSVI